MTDGELGDALAFAHELADRADELTRAGAGEHGPQVADRKDDGSWVTAVDREVEARLRSLIVDRYPDHAVLGEEDGRTGPPDAPTWVLDPIDGTTNFVRGNPIWATLIGLQIGGEDVLGVVSAPALGHRWDGLVGHGARRDGVPIAVSDVDDLSAAEVSFGGLDVFVRHGRWEGVTGLSGVADRVRGYGDFWGHCLVASGSTDVTVEASLSLWDLCAVRALVLAAGGRCTSLDGEETSGGGHVLSSNGVLHDRALAFFHTGS